LYLAPRHLRSIPKSGQCSQVSYPERPVLAPVRPFAGTARPRTGSARFWRTGANPWQVSQGSKGCPGSSKTVQSLLPWCPRRALWGARTRFRWGPRT
jgi:hypothetical protein